MADSTTLRDYTPRSLKSLLKAILGEVVLGAIDFVRFPELGEAWGGPFNGQSSRMELFRSLVECLSPVAIVETGTYLGTTTEFLAEFGVPVFTIEGHLRNYGFARARLWWRRNVMLCRGDSREELRRALDERLRSFARQTIIFYLDAHWNADLPLAEELEITFGRCPAAVVMVDDFQVPNDSGYGYDDYGPGKALTFDYIAPIVARHGIKAFYPATPSIDETGARRGCVVLARSAQQSKILASLPLLRLSKTVFAR